MLIEEAHGNGARYSKACEVVGISHRTLQRWKQCGLKDRRKGSQKTVVRKVPQETRDEIINVCNEPRFRDLTPYEIVPQLLEEGRYLASERTIYRILRKADQVHHRSELRVGYRHAKPPERKATGPNQVYTWDITYMGRTVRGLFYYAYVVKDLFDRSIVGWAVHEEESEKHSRALFARILNGGKVKLKALHADNGHPMKGDTLMALLQKLNVAVSHSRPRTSNDNSFIESLFKTMKYHVTYPNAFDTLEDARSWMGDFVHWYNTEHLHSSIGYVTPHQMRHGQAESIFELRNEEINQARQLHPERWGSRPAKQWIVNREVVLNPDKK
ncbi:Integrase catalytic region [Prosthecochloris aestuarii DSM 271]|uniref:Integrase catalytic region n=2 Tax=Prosthecochloris aestuarii TaxID=1102 RepID=B4S5Q9_PROA2|nr:Integrase catalytic region [Prosthecochloris aestuarii DSM 271]